MKRLCLIRHGLTEPLKNHWYYGSTDVPLLPEGEEALRVLSAQGGYPGPEGFRFLTSGMRRTEQTLHCIYGDLPHQQRPEFREMDFGIFEMHSYEELKDWPEYQTWIQGDYLRRVIPGGESGEIAMRRMAQGLEQLLREPEDTILVCHGGTILCLMGQLFPGEKENDFLWQPPAGHGYTIDLEAKTWRPIPRPWEEKA